MKIRNILKGNILSQKIKKMKAEDESKSDVLFVEYVYVSSDKDELMKWEVLAKENNLNVLLLNSCKKLLASYKYLSKKNTAIYLDYRFGDDEVRGEYVAYVLHRDGFEKIYIGTDFKTNKFESMPWVTFSGFGCPLVKDKRKSDLELNRWHYDFIYREEYFYRNWKGMPKE